jgi:hypothetical protein
MFSDIITTICFLVIAGMFAFTFQWVKNIHAQLNEAETEVDQLFSALDRVEQQTDALITLFGSLNHVAQYSAKRIDILEERSLSHIPTITVPEGGEIQHLRPMFDSQGPLFNTNDTLTGEDESVEPERIDTAGAEPTEAEADSTSGSVCSGDVS